MHLSCYLAIFKMRLLSNYFGPAAGHCEASRLANKMRQQSCPGCVCEYLILAAAPTSPAVEPT